MSRSTVKKANASVKGINTCLSSMEHAASKAARGATTGIDGLTVSMAKGATAGNLFAEGIKNAIELAREWAVGAAWNPPEREVAISDICLAKPYLTATPAQRLAIRQYLRNRRLG